MGRFFTKQHYLGLFPLIILVIFLVTFIARHAVDEKYKGIYTMQLAAPASRDPASIQKVFDFSYLQGDALTTAAKQRMVNSVAIETKSDEAVIEVGNFVMSDENNQKDFACGFYDRVTIVFEAEGVAVSGEKPKLTVESGCELGANINALNPVHLPVQKLMTQKPSETEYRFYDAKQPIRVQLNNPPSDWPTKWNLSEMKLTNSQVSSRILHISSDELSQLTNRPISMNWQLNGQ